MSNTKVFQFFGCEDSVFNHAKLIIDLKFKKKFDILKQGENLLSKRNYTVQVLQNAEFFVLSFAQIDRMKMDF